MLAARHKNYLINPSPCLVLQAGWRLPTQFCAEDDKLLQVNSSVSSSCLILRRMRPVSPQRAQLKGYLEHMSTVRCSPSQGQSREMARGAGVCPMLLHS